MIYPIGAIYISLEPLNLITSYYHDNLDDGFTVEWNGCVWELLNDDIFLRNTSYRKYEHYDGEDYHYLYEVDADKVRETGGEATHTHKYGIAYKGFYGSVHGYNVDSDAIQILDNGAWVEVPSDGKNISTKFPPPPYNNYNAAARQLKANTTSASSLPPYITVYMYKRIA